MGVYQTHRTQPLIVTGWDPVFEYEGKTYAEMDKAAKVCVNLSSVEHLLFCEETAIPPLAGPTLLGHHRQLDVGDMSATHPTGYDCVAVIEELTCC